MRQYFTREGQISAVKLDRLHSDADFNNQHDQSGLKFKLSGDKHTSQKINLELD